MSFSVLTLAVQADGEDQSRVLEIKPRQVLVWEKEFHRSALQLGDDAWKIEYLYELAWIGLGKQGEFTVFCTTTDVAYSRGTSASTGVGADPTHAEASTGS